MLEGRCIYYHMETSYTHEENNTEDFKELKETKNFLVEDKESKIMRENEKGSQKQQAHDENNIIDTKKVPPVTIIFYALLVIGITSFCVTVFKDSMKNATRFLEEAPLALSDTVSIDGLYTFSIENGECKIISTAEISSDSEGYILTLYSDYLPKKFICSRPSDGVFIASGLGEGIILYRPSKSSIKIIIPLNDNKLCILSK